MRVSSSARIYFLTFVESLQMIFSQDTENCELLLDYPKIGGEDIEYFAYTEIKNIFHTNTDVQRRIIIDQLPIDKIKCIEKL